MGLVIPMSFKEWVEHCPTDELIEEIQDSYIHLLICSVLDDPDSTTERSHQYMVDEFTARFLNDLDSELTEAELETHMLYDEIEDVKDRLGTGWPISDFYNSWELKTMMEKVKELDAPKEQARDVAYSGHWTSSEGGDSRDES